VDFAFSHGICAAILSRDLSITLWISLYLSLSFSLGSLVEPFRAAWLSSSPFCLLTRRDDGLPVADAGGLWEDSLHVPYVDMQRT